MWSMSPYACSSCKIIKVLVSELPAGISALSMSCTSTRAMANPSILSGSVVRSGVVVTRSVIGLWNHDTLNLGLHFRRTNGSHGSEEAFTSLAWVNLTNQISQALLDPRLKSLFFVLCPDLESYRPKCYWCAYTVSRNLPRKIGGSWYGGRARRQNPRNLLSPSPR